MTGGNAGATPGQRMVQRGVQRRCNAGATPGQRGGDTPSPEPPLREGARLWGAPLAQGQDTPTEIDPAACRRLWAAVVGQEVHLARQGDRKAIAWFATRDAVLAMEFAGIESDAALQAARRLAALPIREKEPEK